jgi:hypothetical protein
MKKLTILTILGILFSCGYQEKLKSNLNFDINEIELVEVYYGFPDTKVQMKDGFEKEFIKDLNQSKELGPTKFAKPYRILIHYKNKEVDTIITNGEIHIFKGYYQSRKNLIEKYSIIDVIVK